MTVAEFLDEADLELTTLRHVLDTAQHALDVADRTQRTSRRIRRLVRRLVVVALVGLVGAGVAYGVRALRDRRGTAADVTAPSDPGQDGSVAPATPSGTSDERPASTTD